MPIDIEFRLSDPRLLVYESLAMMARFSSEFDYFVNIEDDILLEREAFERITTFDAESLVNECLHPNRMEDRHDGSYCVDLEAMPGWTFHTRTVAGHQLRVALNPHSGLCVLSRAKLRYAMERVDLRRREQIVGGYMASAYANLHGPFAMFRVTDPLGAHKVTHLDWWKNPVAPVAGSDVGDVPLRCEARVEETDRLLGEPPPLKDRADDRGVGLQAPAWVRRIVGRMTGRAAAPASGGGVPPPGTTEC